jgi:hypothetical protein
MHFPFSFLLPSSEACVVEWKNYAIQGRGGTGSPQIKRQRGG